MKIPLIGRKKEQEVLQNALASPEPEMVAVIGRRRVGKTFLVRTFFGDRIVFEMTGVKKASLKRQLKNFSEQLTEWSGASVPVKEPNDWYEAFRLLTTFLKPLLGRQKIVVFLDELPWLASRRSDFIAAFGYFWNNWASRQHIIVVICGSAASWMIKKVINNKGGLYNRVTRRIFMKPFTLSETEHYFKRRNISFSRYHIVQIFMAMGGIPHYLKEVRPGKSAIQNIDHICFSENGLLHDEFPNLYPSLFANSEKHIAVVKALSSKKNGLTRQQLVQVGQLPNGGGLSTVLKELEQSNFINSYFPFGKKRQGVLYRLTDEYSLFYLQFMENRKNFDEDNIWQLLSQTQPYKTWSGYAFENICLKHIPQIKKALGIAGVYSQSSSFYKKGNNQEKGTQIDLVIDRNDHVINLCEIKFHHEPFSITKSYADSLRNKRGIFRKMTKTRKHLELTMIAAFGLKTNPYSLELIPVCLTLDDLFD